jgi:hypothetical protein
LKNKIDNLFFRKITVSRTVGEIKKLFDNYLAFFDTFKEFLPDLSMV